MPGSEAQILYHLYILRCSDGSLYTGIATDPERRLQTHADHRRGARYLRGRLPAELVYAQCVGDRGEAQRLEARVKRLRRADKFRLIEGKLSLSELRQRQASGSSPG